MVAQAISGGGRAFGLSSSPNPAGGLTALAAVYLMTPRYRWVALPLVVAVQRSSSKLALGAVVPSALLDGGARKTRPRCGSALDRGGHPDLAAEPSGRDQRLWGDSNQPVWRLVLERMPEALQSGFVGVGDGPPHNVSVRLAVELGIHLNPGLDVPLGPRPVAQALAKLVAVG